ncbi:MAG: HAD-IA family hydrolase [Leptolyngbyaceae bacterium]|nr:HAD-IA family hydrolase [Leptolyngbyaceae bacterium]
MPFYQNPPKVIFFDAVGTLFGIEGSVGESYDLIAQKHGVKSDPALLNQAFFQSFRKAPPMAFPGAEITSIPHREFQWWRAIALQTFEQVGTLDQFTDFDQFFDDLYAYFATEAPWHLYPETLHTLKYWKEQGVELGIISNFDSRIHRVLEALGLSPFFSSITLSTEVGAAKPDFKIFDRALEKHACPPHAAWHVGDSMKEDYEGAKFAGLRAVWLKRRS